MSSVPAEGIHVLESTGVFAKLDEVSRASLYEQLEARTFAAGEPLVRQGDPNDGLFVIIAGTVQASLEGDVPVILGDIGVGGIIGEVSLAIGGARSATVTAQTAVRTLFVPQAALARALADDPSIMDDIGAAVVERTRRSRVAQILDTMFGGLDATARSELESSLTWIRLDSGQELFAQGAAADQAYIVVVGRARVVTIGRDGREHLVSDVGRGEWIGEMALLSEDGVRSATVYAVRETNLVALTKEAFHRLVASQPKAMFELARVVVSRLQRSLGTTASVVEDDQAVAVVAASPNVDVPDFCRRLTAALGRHGNVEHVSAAQVERALGKPGATATEFGEPARLQLSHWLNEKDDRHRYIVYELDPTWTNWSEIAIRHANHVIFVANASDDPAIVGDSEAQIVRQFQAGRCPKFTLALIQPRVGTTFPNTAPWLRARPHIEQHYHLRRGHVGDIERVVRCLVGKAITLVLGGGGSRGYAHVGVIKALEQLGVPIDAVCGSSIGAVVASGVAMGLRSDELIRVLRPIFDQLIDPTLPLVSFASGQQAMRGTEAVVGKLDIEDLGIPYFAISTNLTRGGDVVHRTGSVGYATRASGSIPGIFPPVPYGDGDLLVDGGVVNNLPIDRMSELFPGAVIAVDVMPEIDLQVGNKDLPMSLSGWEVARRYLSPRKPNVGMPNIVSILMRSATAGSFAFQHAESIGDRAALLLKPHVAQWNMLDFKAGPSIARQGYEHSREQIDDWWAADRNKWLGADPDKN